MFWQEQSAVLERVATGCPLKDVLHDIVSMIERQADGMLCSFLLLDEDGMTIRHGAAASLPADYLEQLDGLRIGPTAGSCGTALYRREVVVVQDIATHPYWRDYKHLALPYGLRACWSTPIFSSEREVLGTFAMYYRELRGPTDAERGWVDAATHLAAIAIVSDRAARALRRSEARAKHMARLHAMSSAIKEAIIREHDAGRLHQIVCDLAVSHGIAKLAWLGFFDPGGQAIAPAAHAQLVGFELAPDQRDRLPGVDRVRSGSPVICNDLADDLALAWKSDALRQGLRAYAVFPMRHRGGVVGALALYSEFPAAFGEEEVNALMALAEHVAFALESARAAVALRQSEERLRTIIENTPDVAIQWFDEAGKIIFYNEASARLFGWTERGALGQSLLELGLWSAAEEARFSDARARTAAGQHVTPMEFSFHRHDGDGVLLSTIFRIPLSASEHCSVCMDVDLTENRRMENAVRAAEAVRAAVYECLTDVVFYLALESGGAYRFESVNRAFLTATGLTEAQVVGRLVDEVIPLPSLMLVKTKYAEALATSSKVVWEEVSTYPSGTKYGQVSVSPVFDADGKCRHLVGTVHDVTALRAFERERREIEAQLHQAQRLQALGTLAGGIAHDFNNILSAIHCNVDLALGSVAKDPEAREAMADVKQAAQRATSLVRQILTFSRRSEPKLERLELPPIVKEALRLVGVSVDVNTRIRATFADDAPPVRADSTQIHQAVMNLVTNAAQAIGGRGGTIEVRLERCALAPGQLSHAPHLAEGTYARLSVRDDGPGMDPETLPRVFEPFFTTKPPGEGTGLGLSVVHGIMKNHQGGVVVQSAPGKGTVFELFFPAAQGADEDTRRAAEPPQRPGRRVLFVDDDEAIVVLARRAFSKLGHAISAHSRSQQALDEFTRRPNEFDVVVMDLNMPQLSGADLIQLLKRVRPDVRIVVTSGHVRPEDIETARTLGVSEILEKPQSLEDLAKMIS